MEQTITFTLGDLYGFILGVCGLITAVAAAVAIVAKLIQKWRSPNKKQNEKLEEHERRLEKVEARLDEGNRQFEADNKRASELEEDLRATTRMIIEALQALMAHALDGNNTDELSVVKKQIDNFLIKKI